MHSVLSCRNAPPASADPADSAREATEFNEHGNDFLSGRNVTREATYRVIQPNNVYADGSPFSIPPILGPRAMCYKLRPWRKRCWTRAGTTGCATT
jgi:hypothetical protein